MFNKISQWLSWPYVWLVFSWLVVILPLLLLGEPGLYGDDFNMYKEMENSSFIEAIEHWLSEYGWSYRPVGITVLYAYYALFLGSPFLLYLGYQLCYLALSLLLYREIVKLTSNTHAGIFAALFFLFFPFNPTAYWQISSLTMVVATLLTIVLIRPLLSSACQRAYSVFFLLSVSWLLLLFSYEQLLGLAGVIGVCIVLKNYTNSWMEAIKKSSIPVMILGVISVVFLIAYISSDGNPKLVSLETLNQVSIETVAATYEEEQVNSIPVHSGRLEHFLARLEKGANFLLNSIAYAAHSLITHGVAGYIMILAVLLLGGGGFFVPIVASSAAIQTALLYFSVGSLWVVITLAPFFLYNKVHIPPYTLMLPSIGLSIAMFGLFQLIVSVFPSLYVRWIIKALLITSVTIFPLMQYGYYFGLKEELKYWRAIANEVEQKGIIAVDNVIVVADVKEKGNQHIFWLERAVGLRYISEQLNHKVITISREGNRLLLKMQDDL